MYYYYTLILLFATASCGPVKRGVAFEGYPQDFAFNNYAFAKPHVPSPAEIAAAIQAAKEASASVMAAQHRVQEAKDEVLNQQHIASHKQAQAALALQKTEAAAAVQQQEAKSAANALIQAQQRLAHAKAEVAELQKIAAAKEAHAAVVIQKSAAAAAAEVQRSDDTARKLAALQHSNSVTLKQANAGKDGSLSATSAAVAAANDRNGAQHVAWVAAPKYVQLNPWG
ncbi:uncharacterized protein LOC123015482 [Tribolium madens]|uniref:uncharacterized protein LOC123015482 n=1 Tax=Tribolium madens TaxID=41895 RepID=UPI001CF72795|nr:uncharacterized protein LOC123015482 [Tribolium madens]